MTDLSTVPQLPNEAIEAVRDRAATHQAETGHDAVALEPAFGIMPWARCLQTDCEFSVQWVGGRVFTTTEVAARVARGGA